MFFHSKKKKFIALTIGFIAVFATITEVSAQRFKGSAVVGLNLAQIDGDSLFGYDRIGLTAGFKLEYPVADRFDVSLEMLYSQRGSAMKFGFAGSSDSLGLSLQYISIPLMITIKDWEVEDKDYHKVAAHAGISPGYLFQSSTQNRFFPGSDELATVDISYLLGITYKFTKSLGMTIRFTSSLSNLLSEGGKGDVPSAKSYFVTWRSEYYF